MTVCTALNLCKAQDTPEVGEPDSTHSDTSVPRNYREPNEASTPTDADSPDVDSGYAEEMRTPEEFLSTTRSIVPTNESSAPASVTHSAQFWAFHEQMLNSVAATGEVSGDIKNRVNASPLPDEFKTLLLRRHIANAETVSREFASGSRGWNPVETAGEIGRGDFSGAFPRGGLRFSVPRGREATSSFGTMSVIEVRIRNHSGWNVAMQFSGAKARNLDSGRHIPSLKIEGDGECWVQLKQPNGNWGTKWSVRHMDTYRIVNRGGPEPLVLQLD